MKQVLFIAILCLISSFIHAQDIITMKDGSEIKAKVVEMGVNEIKYKKFENLDGPIYVLTKSDVFMIKYENGQKEVIQVETNKTEVPTRQDLAEANTSQNISISSSIVKKTNTAGIVGYALSAPILGLATAAAFSDDFEEGGILGAVAAVTLGVSAPFIAGRARKTREITHVDGSPTLRLTGWILYGISLADAAVALGLTIAEVEVPNATVIILGIMGAASSVLFGLDAQKTAQQSKQYIASYKYVPTIRIAQDRFGNQFTSLGVQINF